MNHLRSCGGRSPERRRPTKPGWVYFLASRRNGTIYLGVSSDLAHRIYQHREGTIPGFAKEHNCRTLVWFERHENIHEARLREARLKKWKRAWKLRLIEEDNPQWRDLSDMIEH
ncbi:MAG: GIY-YIG nuclease family protein [Pseudomonadota bacterium]